MFVVHHALPHHTFVIQKPALLAEILPAVKETTKLFEDTYKVMELIKVKLDDKPSEEEE